VDGSREKQAAGTSLYLGCQERLRRRKRSRVGALCCCYLPARPLRTMGAGFGDTGEERCAAVVGGDVAWLDSTFESLVTGGRFGVGHASVPVHLGSWKNSRRYPSKLGA
jgi:hypothetical protein